MLDTVPLEELGDTLFTLILVGAAEFGDKSQLVCIALAARYRAAPVLLGAIAAFLVLNAAAVTVGTGLASWLSEQMIAALVAISFLAFGLHTLFTSTKDAAPTEAKQPTRHIFVATFWLIFVAEFGDKTQLAVIGLASTLSAWAAWLGATVALAGISALSIWLGQTALQNMPRTRINILSGVLFLVFAAIAAWQAFSIHQVTATPQSQSNVQVQR
ncbi:MAG: TMEM165/GDT1 family protein [Pseudomonadota bacterium]